MHESVSRLLDYARKKSSEFAKPGNDFGRLQVLLQVSSATLTNWKSRGVSKEGAIRAERELGCSANWILTGEGDEDAQAKVVDTPEFVEVRRVDVSFSNGEGRVVYSEDDRPPLSFRADYLRKLGIHKGNAIVVDASGISNEPKIRDGAVVLLNRADKTRLNGEFFAFRYDGELLIKRLHRVEGVGILATAENSDFKPKTRIYTDADDFEVIGRAVWTGIEL
ncbi:phage repressor protein C with HTH and peptisase S24 domain [Variovorax boronicumulans]|uniref:LexA family transcriptional regulator n=1 Tax=Variovorax boronicumulans TaxID=436515 RepID=UPI00278B9085|nr:S24 family peptidase [Variovorax boronicumulans]MDQ0068983.1 phage repressor protein C with HTH and peptisase S24 domain [Variovorax boronicumulans]